MEVSYCLHRKYLLCIVSTLKKYLQQHRFCVCLSHYLLPVGQVAYGIYITFCSYCLQVPNWDIFLLPLPSITWHPSKGLISYPNRPSVVPNSLFCPWYLRGVWPEKLQFQKSLLLGGERRAEVHPGLRQGVSNLACSSCFLLTPRERPQLASSSEKHEALRPDWITNHSMSCSL